ncbi:efflux RND transporter periplasmic adaptor subunit [Myxococcota bacterium]|nr:efflux RND transporter periplasmic adaptor subunit [Myxococcota bacterium]
MSKVKYILNKLSFLKKVSTSLLVTAACIGIVILAISHLPEKRQERSQASGTGHDHGAGHTAGESAGETVYTCSMHPSVRRSEPGKCPICHMDLIPVAPTGGGQLSSGGGAGGAGSAGARDAIGAAGIETVRVERRTFRVARQLTGRIVPDLSSKTVVTSWVDGRVEKTYVRFEGERVRAWQAVALLFSPSLTGAQAEFLALIQNTDASQTPLRKAGEMRLANLGMTSKEIQSLIRSNKPSQYNPVYASSGGIVIRRNVYEGSQIKRGEVLYEVVDNKKVWMELDVSMRDNWIRPGQELIVRAEGLEPMPFLAVVDFADYQVNGKTRTFMVRATLDNANQLFRFGAWVRAEAREAAGASDPQGGGRLMVPSSAVLYTGKRSVVYVADDNGGFSPREVEVAEDEMLIEGRSWTTVLTGLSEGETVAQRGAFVIDSNRRIQGSASMMTLPKMEPASKDQEKTEFVGAPLAVVLQMDSLARAYFAVWKGLAGDDATAATTAATAFRKMLADTKIRDSRQWDELQSVLSSSLKKMPAGTALAELRKEFSQLSDGLWGIFRKYGFPPHVNVLRVHCPMAFDNRGADWLQPTPAVENPYFGKEMYRCGSVVSAGSGGTP